ncbi:MAG: AmpG family muropeptide MFS transporter [Betaproteobacteria bacterium]|nr:AmpG family muropeptide MFS transporter [Betaproteobacteria bacterium]
MNDNPTSAQPPLRWQDTFLIFLSPASLRMLALGFSAGLPLLLVLGTLSFRLREAGIERATIGFLSWVGLAYGFKWAWAPLVDRLHLPMLTALLGRRRSWLLLAQLCILLGLLGMASSDPQTALTPLVGFALLVALGSATQDIALDAFRIESAQARLQAMLAASYQTGYRLGMIWAGAGVLWIAAKAEVTGLPAGTYQDAAWGVAYVAMAVSMSVGLLTVLLSPEPAHLPLTPTHGLRQWLREAVIAPVAEFIQRYGWHAVLLLALIGSYRISDIVMGIMANPFYVDMGYSKEEVATVTKLYGVLMTLFGAFLGGAMVLRWGVMRVLMLGAVLSAATNLLFAWLALHGHDLSALIAVVSADNLSSGIASAAFIAYLSSLTQVQYSATQYALFSSLMLLLPKFLAGFSGVVVDATGYAWFFVGTALLGVPVLLIVWLASRFHASTP